MLMKEPLLSFTEMAAADLIKTKRFCKYIEGDFVDISPFITVLYVSKTQYHSLYHYMSVECGSVSFTNQCAATNIYIYKHDAQ